MLGGAAVDTAERKVKIAAEMMDPGEFKIVLSGRRDRLGRIKHRQRLLDAIGDAQRVLLRDRGELIDETLDHEDVVRGPDAAPECGRDSRRLLADVFDADVGQCVGRLGRTVHGIHIEAFHHSDEVVEAGCAHHLYSLGEKLAGDARHD
jgi:hypothetical protein